MNNASSVFKQFARFLSSSVLCLSAAGQTLYVPGGASGVADNTANGNVGIGTSSPTFLLDARRDQNGPTYVVVRNSGAGSESASGFYAVNNLGGGVAIAVRGTMTSTIGDLIRPNYATLATDSAISGLAIGTAGSTAPLLLGTANTERMRIAPNGNVGIGTTSPGSRLQVQDGDVQVVDLGSGQTAQLSLDSDTGSGDLLFSRQSALKFLIRGDVDTNGSTLDFADRTSGHTSRLYIAGAGNVGIGTTTPTHKLAVNGTIKAKEVIVETTGWSDYVFAPDYELSPLSEVEAHIKEHQHLPGIPSAAEVAEHGVSVGEMQAKLLAKIEELTLHVIRIDRENERLRARVMELETAK